MSSEIALNKNDYTQDNIFDKFNMKEYLSKQIYIYPCNEDDFIYKEDIQKYKKDLQSKNTNNINNTNNSNKNNGNNVTSNNNNINNTNTSNYSNHSNNTDNSNQTNNNTFNSNKNDSNLNPVKQKEQNIINEINKRNNFGIKLEQLELRYDNGIIMKFLDVYKPIKYIGHGSFGLVFSVIKIDTQSIYACKIIKKIYDGFKVINICNEVSILKNMDHPRIIKLHEVFNTHDYLFLFMDLIEGGTLKEFIVDRYIKSTINNDNDSNSSNRTPFLTDTECSLIIKSILEGINYIHRKSIMHRDLKPENIMLKNKDDPSSIVICDFGISDKYYNTSLSREKCGTLIYMAPEMIKNRPSDQLVDVFACGIILYILESGGEHPIYRIKMKREKYINELLNIKEGNWKFNNGFPNLARNIFMKLCKVEPFFRYQINKALRHPWVIRDEKYSTIPLTLVETYAKDLKIKKFKAMMGVFIYFNVFKSLNEGMFLFKGKVGIKTNNYNIDCEGGNCMGNINIPVGINNSNGVCNSNIINNNNLNINVYSPIKNKTDNNVQLVITPNSPFHSNGVNDINGIKGVGYNNNNLYNSNKSLFKVKLNSKGRVFGFNLINDSISNNSIGNINNNNNINNITGSSHKKLISCCNIQGDGGINNINILNNSNKKAINHNSSCNCLPLINRNLGHVNKGTNNNIVNVSSGLHNGSNNNHKINNNNFSNIRRSYQKIPLIKTKNSDFVGNNINLYSNKLADRYSKRFYLKVNKSLKDIILNDNVTNSHAGRKYSCSVIQTPFTNKQNRNGDDNTSSYLKENNNISVINERCKKVDKKCLFIDDKKLKGNKSKINGNLMNEKLYSKVKHFKHRHNSMNDGTSFNFD